MITFFLKLFDTDFMPHVLCLRTPQLIWLHAASDGLIAVAYFLIPLGLMRLVQRRRDLAFHWLFVLFAIFILSCGATHVLSIITLWHPIYRFDAVVKVITAASSLFTAFLLIRLIPTIALLPSPEQWRLSNEELQAEISSRENVEAEIRSLNAQLEQRVAERTTELESQNIRLQELKAAWDLAHGFIRDPNGTVTFWCEGSEQLYGWKKHEAVSKNSHQLLQTQFPKPLAEIEHELAAKGSWSGELVHTTKSGSRLHVATHWILQRNESGSAVSVIAVNNDITDRLRAEEATQRLADIVESSIDAIIGSNLDGVVTSWNSSAEALFGYPASEMIGQPVDILTPKDFREEESKILRDASREGGVKRYFTVRAARNGRKIDVSLTVSPIRNSTGVVIGTSQIVHDISETKAQEEAIRISEERQRLAVDAGQIGLWFVDIQTGRRIFNQRFRELHGMRAEEVIPDYPTPLTVIHAEDRSAVELAVRRAMETSTDIAVEYRTKGLDFRTKWLQCRGRARRDSKGNLTGIHGTVIDLTERREMENKLRRMNAELEQFAYAAAHDLQEPLRNVALAAALLKAEPAEVLAVQDPPLLHTIIENSRRMEAMVKDLLSYSRALDGPEGQPVETDANLVLRQVLENLEAAVREKAPSITFDPLPYVFMHHTHLLQILQNLLSNSLKYSGSRPLQIWVGAKIRADDVLIFVKDNGMGISPQFHERAFGMFKRLHNGSITGTGIGLAVCRRIVEHYGGRIWIESQLGEGATFSFTIPTASNR